MPRRVKRCTRVTEIELDLREAIYTRRAIREFTAEPVSESIVRDLIDAAVQAPSAVNQQPWSFWVVRNQALLADMARKAKTFMLRTSPVGLVSHHFDRILDDPSFNIFYHAPVLIVIATVAEVPWAVEDSALAAQNLMLAARAAKLGTCWIGFAQAWLATDEGKAMLGLPVPYRPVAPIIVGHPKSSPPPVPRRAPEIHWVDR